MSHLFAEHSFICIVNADFPEVCLHNWIGLPRNSTLFAICYLRVYFIRFQILFSVFRFHNLLVLLNKKYLPGGSVVKNPPANAGDLGSIPGMGRSPGKEMARLSSILAWRFHGQRSLAVFQFTGS